MKRGYYGIAFWQPKWEGNIGTAIRSAHCFGVDFLAVIGKRYKKTPQDTMATQRHIPIYEYTDIDDFLKHIPVDCELITVEVDGEDIKNFVHPESAIYLIGGEDRTLPGLDYPRISFPTSHCLNMAMTGTLISYDRIIKNK